MKKLKRIPKFKSDNQESEFWSKSDSTKYIDCEKAKKIYMSELKPSSRSRLIRLPEIMINNLKTIVNRMDIP